MQSFITKITRSEKFSAIPSSKWNEANIRIMNMTMGWNSSHKIFLEISLLYTTRAIFISVTGDDWRYAYPNNKFLSI